MPLIIFQVSAYTMATMEVTLPKLFALAGSLAALIVVLAAEGISPDSLLGV